MYFVYAFFLFMGIAMCGNDAEDGSFWINFIGLIIVVGILNLIGRKK